MVRRWARGNTPSVHVPGTSFYRTKSNINMLDLDKFPPSTVRIYLKKSLSTSWRKHKAKRLVTKSSTLEWYFNCFDYNAHKIHHVYYN